MNTSGNFTAFVVQERYTKISWKSYFINIVNQKYILFNIIVLNIQFHKVVISNLLLDSSLYRKILKWLGGGGREKWKIVYLFPVYLKLYLHYKVVNCVPLLICRLGSGLFLTKQDLYFFIFISVIFLIFCLIFVSNCPT